MTKNGKIENAVTLEAVHTHTHTYTHTHTISSTKQHLCRQESISPIGFICYAKINCKAHKKSSKNLAKIEYKIKKWVDYEKQEKARNSLPFYIL